MILSLKKLLFGWTKKSPKANDTATTALNENDITTVKTASDMPHLLAVKTTFFDSFFEYFQKKSFFLLAFFKLNLNQGYYYVSTTLNLWLYFLVVVQDRVAGGDKLIISLQHIRK